MMMICHLFGRIFAEDDGHGENTEENFNRMLSILNQKKIN